MRKRKQSFFVEGRILSVYIYIVAFAIFLEAIFDLNIELLVQALNINVYRSISSYNSIQSD